MVRKAVDTVSKLNNTAATLTLKVATSGPTIDEVSYTEIVRGMSYARTCDGDEMWQSQAVSTEGLPNCTEVKPVDETEPVIGALSLASLQGVASIPITVTDDSELTVTAIVTQYGATVASSTGGAQIVVLLDTMVLPNGPIELQIVAVDAAGNSSTLAGTLMINNPIASTPPVPPEPVATPVISGPSLPPREVEPPTSPPISEAEPIPRVPEIAVPALTVSAVRAVSPVAAVSKTFATAALPLTSQSKPVSAPFKVRENGQIADEAKGDVAASAASVAKSATPPSRALTSATPSSLSMFIGAVSIAGYGMWRYLRRTKP